MQDRERKGLEDRENLFPGFEKEFGHWEMDFIVSKESKYSLLVLVERKSKYVKIRLIENRKNFLVNEEVFSLLKNEKVLSITTDNDIAFSK